MTSCNVVPLIWWDFRTLGGDKDISFCVAILPSIEHCSLLSLVLMWNGHQPNLWTYSREHSCLHRWHPHFFSKDIASHKKLLNQFFEIADQHGIMLSERKIQLAQSQIDFLGMHFFQGTYQPQPHIAQELLNFFNKNLTVKQIQQFLGTVNYIRDFIPRAAQYTSSLSKLLKKNSSPW